jgi:hypothetical protein
MDSLKKNILPVCLWLGCFLTACTFENDIKIVDEFYDGYMVVISKVDTDAGSVFVRSFKEGYFENIVTNCDKISFDSSTFYISTRNSPTRFYKITLREKERGKYMKTELDKTKYEAAIRFCKSCSVKDY